MVLTARGRGAAGRRRGLHALANTIVLASERVPYGFNSVKNLFSFGVLPEGRREMAKEECTREEADNLD